MPDRPYYPRYSELISPEALRAMLDQAEKDAAEAVRRKYYNETGTIDKSGPYRAVSAERSIERGLLKTREVE